jgi:hypothetical protein
MTVLVEEDVVAAHQCYCNDDAGRGGCGDAGDAYRVQMFCNAMIAQAEEDVVTRATRMR